MVELVVDKRRCFRIKVRMDTAEFTV